MSVDVPLELQPRVVKSLDLEGLDSGQIQLIEKHHALDLILIENASELFRLFIQDDRHPRLEQVLKAIAIANKVDYIPSLTFPPEGDDPEQYEKNVKFFRRELAKTRSRIVVTIIAQELSDDAGGHYCAMIYFRDAHTVQIFDSMQESSSGSDFTKGFEDIAKVIFPPFTTLRHPECFNESNSLQPTGGFLSDESTLDEQQNEDSQNHFCYMWAIWYIHHICLGYNIITILSKMREQEMSTLVVIKKYIYCILCHMGWLRNIPRPDFFERHFHSIWTKRSGKTFVRYRFTAEKPECRDINSCFEYSLEKQTLVKEPFTDPKPTLLLLK